MADQVLTFEEYLSVTTCARGHQAGYEPPTHGVEEEAGEILLAWAQGGRPWRRYGSDPIAVNQWMDQSRLSVLLSGSATSKDEGVTWPPEISRGYWLPSESPCNIEGRTTVDVLGESVQVQFKIPFYYRTKKAREIVFCDLSRQPIEPHQWASFVQRAKWTREAFRRATGKTAYVRYIAPMRQVERDIKVPAIPIRQMVLRARAQKITADIDPGPHCEFTTDDGTYRCPLRQSGSCNPMNPQDQ